MTASEANIDWNDMRIIRRHKSSQCHDVERKLKEILNEFEIDNASNQPAPTANQYFVDRKKLKSKMKLIISKINTSIPIDARFAMINTKILFILSHYGLHHILHKLYGYVTFDNIKKLKSNDQYDYIPVLIFTIGATERFDALSDIMSLNSNFKWKFNLFFEEVLYPMAFILIENKNNPLFCQKKVFEKILFYLLVFKQIYRNIKSMPQPLLNQIYQRDKLVVINEIFSNIAVLLGYIMMLFCHNVHALFQSNSITTLKRMIEQNVCIDRIQDYSKCFVDMIQEMKSMQSPQMIYHQGRKMAINAFYWKDNTEITTQIMCWSFILGKIHSLEKEYDAAIQRLMIYGVACNYIYDAFQRIVTLKCLSINCYENKQYGLALKCIKLAYKFTSNEICNSFRKKEYIVLKQKMEIEWKKFKCNLCGKTNSKLKCCIGCMNAAYCSRRCQKIHWKKQHKYKCSGVWQAHYNLFKKLVIQ